MMTQKGYPHIKLFNTLCEVKTFWSHFVSGDSGHSISICWISYD